MASDRASIRMCRVVEPVAGSARPSSCAEAHRRLGSAHIGHAHRQGLRANYVKVHRCVYAPKGLALDARDHAYAAWLWSRREAVLVGNSAAAMLGTKWLPADEPAELTRSQFRSPKAIVAHSGAIADDEICRLRGIPCTTAARTAYDIGRRMPMDKSIIRMDSLLNATRVRVADVEAITDRYPGARDIRRLRAALDLVATGDADPGQGRSRTCSPPHRHGPPRLDGRCRTE